MTMIKRNDRQARISRLKGRAEELEAKLEGLSKSLKDAVISRTDLAADHSPDIYFAAGMYMAMSERIATQSNELSLQKFQSVRLMMAFSDGWGHCINEESGEEGIVPLSILKSTSGFQVSDREFDEHQFENKENKPKLVKKLSISDDILVKEPGSYTCVVDRMAERINEISLQFGQEIRVLMVFSDGWGLCLNEITGEQGIAPLNILKGSKAAKFLKNVSNSSVGYYKVLVDRIPLQANELMLLKGNIVNVSSVFSDGWCQGMNIETLESGDCPFNVLEWIEDQSLSNILKNLQSEKTPSMDFKRDDLNPVVSDQGSQDGLADLDIKILEIDPKLKKVDEIVNQSLEETKNVLHQVNTIIEELVEVDDEQIKSFDIPEINKKDEQRITQIVIMDIPQLQKSDTGDAELIKSTLSDSISDSPSVSKIEDLTNDHLEQSNSVTLIEFDAKAQLERKEDNNQSQRMNSIMLHNDDLDQMNTNSVSEFSYLLESDAAIESKDQDDDEISTHKELEVKVHEDTNQSVPMELLHYQDGIADSISESVNLLESDAAIESKDQDDDEISTHKELEVKVHEDTNQSVPMELLHYQDGTVDSISESVNLLESDAAIESKDQDDEGIITQKEFEVVNVHEDNLLESEAALEIEDQEDLKNITQPVIVEKLEFYDQDVVDTECMISTISMNTISYSFDIINTNNSNNAAIESENSKEHENNVDLMEIEQQEKGGVQIVDNNDHEKNSVTLLDFGTSTKERISTGLSDSSGIIISEIDNTPTESDRDLTILSASLGDKYISEENLKCIGNISGYTDSDKTFSNSASFEFCTENSIFATNKVLILDNGLKFIEIQSSASTFFKSKEIPEKSQPLSYIQRIPKNSQDFIGVLRVIRMVSIFLLAVQFLGFVCYSLVNTILILKSHLGSLLPSTFTTQDLSDWLGYVFIDVFEIDRFPVFTGNTLAIIALLATVWEGILIGFDV